MKASKKSSVGVIGSLGARFDERDVKGSFTTPQPIELHRVLAQMVDAGVTHVAMEVSSHALDQDRVAGIHFKTAAFTNLSHDHLDYHETEEKYFQAKARLFNVYLQRSRARGRVGVFNIDDAYGRDLAETCSSDTIRVASGENESADLNILNPEYSLSGTKAQLKTAEGVWDIQPKLIGPHNLSNVAIAAAIAKGMGISQDKIIEGINNLEHVPGRLEKIVDPERNIFIDYAHTPHALESVLLALKPHVKGRLLVVFGAGGGRDKNKRKPMGQAVGQIADVVWLTNDNPREELPQTIADAVLEGLKASELPEYSEGQRRGYIVELDRQNAIYDAIAKLAQDDVLIIAGKGHETTQTIGNTVYYFSDHETVSRALRREDKIEAKVLEEIVARSVSVTENLSVDDVIGEATDGVSIVEVGAPDVLNADEEVRSLSIDLDATEDTPNVPDIEGMEEDTPATAQPIEIQNIVNEALELDQNVLAAATIETPLVIETGVLDTNALGLDTTKVPPPKFEQRSESTDADAEDTQPNKSDVSPNSVKPTSDDSGGIST